MYVLIVNEFTRKNYIILEKNFSNCIIFFYVKIINFFFNSINIYIKKRKEK